MPRRGNVPKHVRTPDPRYGEAIVSRFVNSLMRHGKKSTARRALYKALDIVAEKTSKDSLEVFKKAIENVKPVLEVKSRRVGGATYQVPMEVRPTRREALSVRWIVSAARSKGAGTMSAKLAEEIIDAFNKRGSSIKKREDVHKMAEANKAFAHYRW